MSKPKPTYIGAKNPLEYRCFMDKLPLEHIDFSLKEAIDAHLNAKGHQVKDSNGWIYPSSIGSCDRQVLYNLKKGTPGREMSQAPALKLSGIGNALHDMYQDWAIEALGAEEFEAEKSFRLETQKLSMRIDGVMAAKDWIIEFKTLGETGYKNLRKPRDYDLLQVHCYMFTLDMPRAILYYINRNTGEDCEFKVYFDPSIWQEILNTIARVMQHEQEGTVPPRISNTFWCSRCRYFEYCMDDKA